MRALFVSLVAGFLGSVLAQQYGDSPHDWAKTKEILVADGGIEDDQLMRSLTCVLEYSIHGGKSMQCREDFLFVGPKATVERVYNSISNVQVEGYVLEARGVSSNVGTFGEGKVDRGVVFDGNCYGNVDQCVVKLGRGWELRTRPNALYLVGPDGKVKQTWNSR